MADMPSGDATAFVHSHTPTNTRSGVALTRDGARFEPVKKSVPATVVACVTFGVVAGDMEKLHALYAQGAVTLLRITLNVPVTTSALRNGTVAGGGVSKLYRAEGEHVAALPSVATHVTVHGMLKASPVGHV